MYRFTVTNAGCRFLARITAEQEPLVISRVMFGTGTPPEDESGLLDMTTLAEPLSEGVCTAPIYENDMVKMSLQFRNDLNGGLNKTVYLKEFGLFATDPDGGEVMIYYGDLSSAPDSVLAYDGAFIHTRNYDIYFIVGAVPDVNLEVPAGAFLTSEDAQAMIDAAVNPKAEALTTHINDTTKHITASERKAWNEKQSALTFDSSPKSGSGNPVTSNGIYTALSGKANSSHGTHVSYSSTAPVMDGTASAGSAAAVSRSDHRHPTDTSRAAASALTSHTGDTAKHITASERKAWNNKADASHIELLKDKLLSGNVPYGKELTESWDALRTRIKAGNFTGLHIGDFKTIQLTTGETVVMEVAGIDQYYRCGDTEIGHHVDFISRDCLAGTKAFNDTNTNQGTAAEPNPWRASKLFQTLNNGATGVFSTLPADLKPCIIEKRAQLETRFSEAGALNDSTGWTWYNMGKLWLPTEVEVFGNAAWSDVDWGSGGGGCNKQYPIFIGGSLHLIKGNGNGGARCFWWEVSVCRADVANVCSVYDSGNDGIYIAIGGRVCAPLCFRIG